MGERDGGALARKSLDVAEIGQMLDAMKPAEVYSNEEVNQAIKSLDRASRASVGAKRAAKAATGEATQAREHVLAQYAPLLPSNPRLIKRVANAWGMLMALGDHVGHQEDQDVVIRAAILMVRFPVLVDALLTDVDLPSGVVKKDIQDGGSGELPVAERLWQRSDVQAVVGDYTPRQLARCFGRDLGELPPEDPADVPQPEHPTEGRPVDSAREGDDDSDLPGQLLDNAAPLPKLADHPPVEFLSASLSPSQLVTSLRSLLGARLVAYLGSVNETGSVQQWANGEREPTPLVLDRLRVAHDVASLLTAHDPPSIAQVWFQGMNPLLEDDAPARLLRDGDLLHDGARVMAAARAFVVDG